MFAPILLLLFVLAKADENVDKSQLPISRLKTHLLTDYEKSLRPVVNQKDTISVSFRMILKYFLYSHDTSSFTVDSWLAMSWKDEHLTWDPNNYESIQYIHMSTNDIWMPDISVYNRDDQSGSPAAVDSATCVVTNKGQVVCVPPSRQNSLCVADMTRYPFDTQNCTIRFGSWVHSGEEIDLKLAKTPISTSDLISNGEFALVDTKAFKHPGIFKCCPNNTYPSLNFNFIIKRLAGAHVASVVLPALALVVTTLTSLWIAPADSDRLILCYVNLICEFLYSQYVSWMVPLNGEKVALILIFARDSLILCAFTIVFTFVLKKIVDNKNPAPGWMSSFVSILIACRVGQFILLKNTTKKDVASAKGEEDGSGFINIEENYSSPSQDRSIFAKFLDTICFIAYSIVYLCMFIAFFP